MTRTTSGCVLCASLRTMLPRKKSSMTTALLAFGRKNVCMTCMHSSRKGCRHWHAESQAESTRVDIDASDIERMRAENGQGRRKVGLVCPPAIGPSRCSSVESDFSSRLPTVVVGKRGCVLFLRGQNRHGSLHLLSTDCWDGPGEDFWRDSESAKNRAA